MCFFLKCMHSSGKMGILPLESQKICFNFSNENGKRIYFVGHKCNPSKNRTIYHVPNIRGKLFMIFNFWPKINFSLSFFSYKSCTTLGNFYTRKFFSKVVFFLGGNKSWKFSWKIALLRGFVLNLTFNL